MAPSKVPPEDKEAVIEARELVAELCRHFYTLGWVSGTGTVSLVFGWLEASFGGTKPSRCPCSANGHSPSIALDDLPLSAAALASFFGGVFQEAASASK